MMGAVSALLVMVAAANAQTADEIMTRVGENQDRAESLRASYIYHQSLVRKVKKANGTVSGEQIGEYDVIPGPAGTEKKLVSSSNTGESIGMSMQMEWNDRVNVDFGTSMLQDAGTRDGIGAQLFPLTVGEQRRYLFRLKGREKFGGVDVYRVHFEPRKLDDPEENSCWSGDVLVDAREYQPVLTQTKLARGIPMAARILLGTSLKGFGFRLTYRKFEDGVWFPVEYDADFTARILFAYRRRISFSMKNSGFRKTDVASSVEFEP